MNFAEKLRLSLKTRKMSQRELARRIGRSHSCINSYCLNKCLPLADVLVLICIELDESADYFIGLKE